LPWHLAQLTLAPADLHHRVQIGLTAPSPVTMRALDAAVLETLDLVDRYIPGADTRVARYAIELRPRPAA